MLNPTQIIEEYKTKTTEINTYLNDLRNIIIEYNSSLEGNSFYVHETLDLYPELLTKQINLFWVGKQGITRMCEIGFNAGHSTMLLLLGREKTPIEFTVFDIGHHSYTKPCLEYIKTNFTNVNFEYIEGDSTVTMPEWIKNNEQYIGKYDVVHVDGGHSEHCIQNDMRNATTLVKKGGFVIVDDTNCDHINFEVDNYICLGIFMEVDVLKTNGYPHRVLRKLR